MTFDCRFQCSRVGLEVKIYDTPAGGIRASQGTFSSCLYVIIIQLCNLMSLSRLIICVGEKSVDFSAIDYL